MNIKRLVFLLAVLGCAISVIPCQAAKVTITKCDSTTSQNSSITSLKDALSEFKSLSHRDKKVRFREMKKVLKQYKSDKKAGKDVDSNVVLQVILGLFIPPLGVYLHEGETNNKFWISVLLTVLGLLIFGFAGILFLGTLPSIIYALIVILSN